MYHRWIDRWDERRARLGEVDKQIAKFELGSDLLTSDLESTQNFKDFCRRSQTIANDPRFYASCSAPIPFSPDKEGLFRFASSITTDVAENNAVVASVSQARHRSDAIVIFHHWNATSKYTSLANYFVKRGITVAQMALPYHFQRSRPGASHADYFVSPNLGRTIQSFRQAVLDGHRLIRSLRDAGHKEVYVLGLSFGSWVAALVAAHDPKITKASLFLTGGSAADVAWSGRATRSIRQSLEPHLTISDLRTAWAPIDLGNYVELLSRPGLDLQIILAKRDTVVHPENARRMIEALENAGARPLVSQFNCGHYSLAMPPFNVLSLLKLKNFLLKH